MIFVDSSAWFAVAFAGDRHNAVAKRLIKDAERIVTTDHVLVESWLLIKSRFDHYRAESFWRNFRGQSIDVEIVTKDDIERAWVIGEKFNDQTFSIVDRTSFVVMERLGIERAISFDNDFVIYRYGPNRDRAFEVLR